MSYKYPVKNHKVKADFGFKETVDLEIKRPTESVYHHGSGEGVEKFELGKPIYKMLCKKLGTYGISWYFCYASGRVKYFDNNEQEWGIKSLRDLIRGVV